MAVKANWTILMYHDIAAATRERYTVTPGRFRQHCILMKEQGVAFGTVCGFVAGSANGEGSMVSLTFDDGYRSVHETAHPIAYELGIRFSVFVTTGWMGTREGYLDWNEVRALRAQGHEIGSHGVTHRFLGSLSGKEIAEELSNSKKTIEDYLGEPVTSLSLPGGRGSAEVIARAREAGYRAVLTSIPGRNRIGDPFLKRRLITSDTDATDIQSILEGWRGADWITRGAYEFRHAAKLALGDDLYHAIWRKWRK